MQRTLRYMAHSLSLREAQVAELARLLSAIETERAQAAVDERRVQSGFADAVAGSAFDAGAVKSGVETREKSQGRLRTVVADTLQKTHSLLDPEQREKLSYMLRTGALTI